MQLKVILIMLLVACAATLEALAYTPKSLMPDDIINLSRSGKSEDLILSEIRLKGIGFQVNLPVMQRFINAGVSRKIIEVIMDIDSGKSTQRFDSSSSPSLTILTDPPGMKIYIDGVNKGTTPFLSNKMTRRDHIVRVEHPLYFTREEKVHIGIERNMVLNWKMEPREPIIRVQVIVFGAEEKYPWTWIIRPREVCPGNVTVKLKSWGVGKSSNEAVFILDDESKKIFRGVGDACLEVFLWRGQIRNDLPIRKLPPCTARYFITDIRLHNAETVSMLLQINVNAMDPEQPVVTLESKSGHLINTADKKSPRSPERLKDNLLDDLDLILQ